MKLNLEILQSSKLDYKYAKSQIELHHYLHTFPPAISMPFVYAVYLPATEFCNEPIGTLVFNRVKAQRKCGDWYGSVEAARSGQVEVTRWQVLNLARVWFSPTVQSGGELYAPELLPGFVDRRGKFRSTLATTAIHQALDRVGFDYLLQRCVVFQNEPYEITHCLSYCDHRIHKGTIYQEAGFGLYRTNADGIHTYRKELKPLTEAQHLQILSASDKDSRARRKRGAREQALAQLVLPTII